MQILHKIITPFVLLLLALSANASLNQYSSLNDTDALLEIWGKHAIKNTQTITPGVDKSAPIFHGSYDWHSSVHSHFAGMFAGQHLQQNAMQQALRSKYTASKVTGERFYHSWNEATYGYPWLLLYASYLLEADPASYQTLKPFISKAYNAAYYRTLGLSYNQYEKSLSSGYSNFNFVLLAVHRYAQKIGDSSRMEYAANLLKAYAPKVHWDNVAAGDFFEPKALAALAYKEIGLKGVAWDKLLAFYEQSDLSVPANYTDLGAHAKGRVLSAAWGDWIMYKQTQKAKYLNAFIAKVNAGYQETKPDDDFVGTGHWLPSFGVFALKMVVDASAPVTPVDPNLLKTIKVAPAVFVDDIEIDFPSERNNAQVEVQIINWANVSVRKSTHSANKGNQKIKLTGLKTLWAEAYKLKVRVDNKVFYASIRRKSWWLSGWPY